MTAQKLTELRVGFRKGSRPFDPGHPTLIMIHGAGGMSRIWQPQIFLLNAFFNTLALDLPGHGESPDIGLESIKDYAVWLAEIINDLEGPRPFVMGHSMGGAIVQEMAVDYPDIAAGIILVGTGPRLTVSPDFLEGLMDRFEETVDSVIRYAYAPGTDGKILKQGSEIMRHAGSKRVFKDFYACDRFDIGDRIEKIQCPCLIVCGEQDRLTPLKLSRSLREKIIGSDLSIITGAGHMVMIEAYGEFNDRIKGFISSFYRG